MIKESNIIIEDKKEELVSKINFEPAYGYVCLEYPDDMRAKLNGKIIIPEHLMKKAQQDYFEANGNRPYKIIAINNYKLADNELSENKKQYQIGDKVMIDGGMEQKAVLKSKESWINIDKPEFEIFFLATISQIQGKLIY